ncbi:RHS repeat-associated protein [Clostridium pascui]|uniref:DNRLRE domain-containing protein n=1 Tax=Clostridium pascui TaxID=46609 RepID=UPI001956A362|nr:DNRLRE domain-containing protein [Clostridium pascui]MBM7871480.1 RHS repeat-associated protein [Clostridium pascui]
MNKLFQQRIATMLIVFMITVMLPVRVFAAGEDGIVTTAQEISENINIESEELEAKIVGEVKEKREKNVKYFFKDNGTYEAAIYNTPVHYLENGVWKDIDNSLIEEKDEENSNVLGNRENDYKVKIAKNSNAKKLVTIAKDNYELSWNIENPKESPVVVQALEEAKLNEDTEKETLYDLETNKIYKKKSETEKEKIKKNAIENEKKKIVKNTSSSVKFTEIFEGVDISYDILSDNVKENIIINKPIENSTFKFNLYIKNLVPKLQKDKTIVFYDKNDTSKAVFMMKAPFMVDAKNQHSENVEISLEENENGYALLLTPDEEWLNDSSRAFPVVLDPPVKTNLGINSIEDTFVASKLPTENKYNSILIGAGNGSASGVTRSFLKFELPEDLKKPGSVVVNAKLNLSLFTENMQAMYVDVHKVLANWDSKTITWNNKPDYYTYIEDYEVVKGILRTCFDWDITSIVREWYKNGNNYGVMIKAHDESTGYNEFLSSDCSDAYASSRPQIVIQYVNNSGLEDYWTYHSQDAGRAGTGYINDANGNLVFTHNDLTMNGNRMPVSISHVFNSNDRASSMGYGNGWRLNLSQRITPKSFEGTIWYEYIDGDGTRVYFKPDSQPGVYKDESGTELTLNKNADGTFTINDKMDNLLIFTSAGYLLKIQDSNGNVQLLSYQGTTLKSITDGAGRTTNFRISDSGYLLGIIEPSGRETSFAYTGTKLTKITYPDGKIALYDYDINNNLINVTNIDGYKITYGYNTNAPYTVKSVQETGTDGTPGGNLNLVYGTNTTIFTQIIDNAQPIPNINRNIYQFNNYGNTISIKENDDATAVSYRFGREENKDKNKLIFESKIQKTITNHLKNHNVEITNDSWSGDYWGTSLGSTAFTTEAKYIGNQSIKITKTNNTARHFYNQLLTLEKGKTYTLSGYVKGSGISSTNGKGAALFVNYQNKAGTYETVESKFISGNKDFERIEVTFTVPSDALSANVYARAGLIEETGTAYFDCLQLEEGEMSNRYNLVENSDFNYGTTVPTYWNKNSYSTVDDISTKVNEKSTFQFKGSATLKKNINQTIKISGKADDVFILSGWAMGNSVPVSEEGERYFALDIGFKKADGSYVYKVVPFNEDTTGWQYAADEIVPGVDYTEVNVYGLYYNNFNTVNFDNIQLYREEFGTNYNYNAQGNLESNKDLSGNDIKFGYDGNNNRTSITEGSQVKLTSQYDPKHNLDNETTAENVISSFEQDSYGNPTKSKVGNESLFMESESAYTTSGNYMSQSTDSSGNKVNYSYDETKGTLNNVKDARGNTINYTYDNMDRVNSVSSMADGQEVKNSYGYENDKLKSITHNGFNYNFLYDSLGNNTEVSAGNQRLIKNTFDNLTGNLTKSEYGNGQTTSIIYDYLGRATGRTYNGVEKFKYSYDASGNLGKHVDLENGVTYRYFYDMANKLTKIEDSNKNSTEYNFNIGSNLTGITEKINNATYSTTYGYDKDNRLKETKYGSNSVLLNYDTLARLKDSTINTGEASFKTSYEYEAGAKANSTTEKVSVLDNNGEKIGYTYDKNGNIETITYNKGEGTENQKKIYYTYNELNELIREDNELLNKTIKYSYDLGGNILKREEFNYTREVPQTLVKTYEYKYEDTNWKDKLTSFDGKPITYDAIGNPLSDGNYTYTWEQGRQLKSITKENLNISFKYNDAGIRTEKTVNGKTTKYHLVGDKVTFETDGENSIYYTYDVGDKLVSMNLNGVEYCYIRNLQGDITGLFDKTGTQVVSYTYDSWGQLISIKDKDGSDVTNVTTHIGYKNPYRYRGYRYDSETQLYYLQSRYYNPSWERFINADDAYILQLTQGQLLGSNLFSYCLNNPINDEDPSGYYPCWKHMIIAVTEIFAFINLIQRLLPMVKASMRFVLMANLAAVKASTVTGNLLVALSIITGITVFVWNISYTARALAESIQYHVIRGLNPRHKD